VLDGVLEHHPHFVPAAGGSIVAEAGTYEEPLSRCFTIWIKASPEEHLSRVGLSGVDDGIGPGVEPATRGEDASNAPPASMHH
jgi:shikimate kinase